MDPATFHPQPLRRVGDNDSELKPENDASEVAEVTLVVIAPSIRVSEASQHKIKLSWPNGDRFAQGDVDSSANDEVPGIVAGVSDRRAGACTHSLHISVSIRMGSAKLRVYEGLEVFRTILQDWANVIGKQIAAGLHSAPQGARAVSDRREIKSPGGTRITLEVSHDSKPVIDVNGHSPSAAV